MNEVVTEIEKLSTEMENMKQEQSTFLTYDKRVKEMAQELTGMYVQYKHHSIDYVIVFSFFHILPHQACIVHYSSVTRATRDTGRLQPTGGPTQHGHREGGGGC